MSIDPKTLTFAELQDQVGEWSKRNFPNNTPENPFFGLVEETGEFAHSILKARQGIRGTKEKHEAAEKDAIGDIVIYLADFCERNGLILDDGVGMQTEDYFDIYVETFAELDAASSRVTSGDYEEGHATADECFRNLVKDVGDLADSPTEYDAGEILIDLAAYCHHRGWSLAEIVAGTWSMVRQRDWTKNKANGQVAAENGAGA